MPDLTHLIEAAAGGDRHAADQLLPLVYDELRKLAAAKMAAEHPGHTLNATALVYEAYLRLVGDQQFDGRAHFFAAAAEAMRRILVDAARRKRCDKHGGQRHRVDLPDIPANDDSPNEKLLLLDAALTKFAVEEPLAARLVELHHFGGLSIDDVAVALGMSRATAYRHWMYGRAWLRNALTQSDPG
jgi:RNA polymerase sigma factor (TIGR02999 family)